MTKEEIEFLRAAGFTLAEIMAMQNDENKAAAPAGSAAEPQQTAQKEPDPTPASAPAAGTQPAAAGDNNPELTKILTQILGAIQAGNRSGAALTTPEKKSPEEIAGMLY